MNQKTSATPSAAQVCSICKGDLGSNAGWDFGNNAWPVNRGRCCDDCNSAFVIPARISINGMVFSDQLLAQEKTAPVTTPPVLHQAKPPEAVATYVAAASHLRNAMEAKMPLISDVTPLPERRP